MTQQFSAFQQPVYIVDGCRTPFLKARGQVGPFAASDLAVATAQQLLVRQSFPISAVDEFVTGCMMPSEDEANISRVIALRLGCEQTIPAYTVQRNCASGMQALDNAAQSINQGRADIVVAGGTEAMSRAPLIFQHKMVNWLGQWMAAKTILDKTRTLMQFRPQYLAPIITLLRGLRDPIVGLSMGQTAENLAYQFAISRAEMDEFAYHSHQRLADALTKGYLDEITPLFDTKGHVYDHDDGVRPDTTIEKLAGLKPFFDKKFGMVTPGNSSQVTDGACFLVLASEQAVAKYNLPTLARIVDCQWAGLDPAAMGLGPVHAATPILKRHKLQLADIDYWEINEAFAAQVLACLRAWQDDDYCREQLGLNSALGSIDRSKLNIDGGAVAVGHPVGTSGARIVLHLCKVLEREQAKRGLATICIGGGQGGAMLLETH